LDHDQLIALGSKLINAILDAADPDTLGKTYWTRAQTALRTGASGTHFSEVVTRICDKLQIVDSLPDKTGKQLAAIATELADPSTFAAWSELMRSDTIWIIAVARMDRKARKDAK